MEKTDSLTSYVASFVDELVRVGVNEVVISPGSRSTPMAILMAEHPEMKVYVNIDERSAAFFALGIAKAKGSPVALLCTSGTAAANYYPAIVEAHYSRVPLLVLTADRPHELRDVGAPQAIDQNIMFGRFTKWFVEMALPENSTTMVNYVRTVAARAAGKSLAAPAGPVHLNFPFREPLLPNLTEDVLWEKGRSLHTRKINITIGSPCLSEQDEVYYSNLIKQFNKGLIICGAHDDQEFPYEVTQLAEALQFPILADPLSQLRSGTHSKELVIDSYDAFLRNDEFSKLVQPDIIIRFGAMPVSKALLLYLKKLPNIPHLVVDGDGGWREPTLTATEMVYCHENSFCRSILNKSLGNRDNSWLQGWQSVNKLTKERLLTIKDEESLFEGKIFTELQEVLPEKTTLFVGNSMPIRDLDSFFTNNEKKLRVLANRGANGIDGVVSTALGVSTNEKVVLVIGDLSFYHDLNGLLAAKRDNLDITVVLINNDGGGIFSFLPQANEETHFEHLFGTPVGLDYEYVVKMYNGVFSSITTWDEFRKELIKSLENKGLSVIQLKTNRYENVEKHRTLWNSVSQEITNQFGNH